MEIKDLAKNMAERYKEDERKWLLMLKRLEYQGYSIIPTNNVNKKERFFCSNCGRELTEPILENDRKPYCHHCIFKKVIERNLP